MMLPHINALGCDGGGNQCCNPCHRFLLLAEWEKTQESPSKKYEDGIFLSNTQQESKFPKKVELYGKIVNLWYWYRKLGTVLTLESKHLSETQPCTWFVQ